MLRLSDAGLVGVGSPDWFNWLGLEKTTSFSVHAPTGVFTARKEPRTRGGAYWYLYRKVGGQRYKVYLGRAADLTPARLTDATNRLAVFVGQATWRSPNRLAEPLLVGRDQELEVLSHALEVCLSGRGRLVLIEGEAGIGKTALAEALGHMAADRGAAVLIGRCYDRSATPPFGLWDDVLARLAPTTRAALSRPPLARPSQGASMLTQTDVFDQVIAALRIAARQRPVVVLLDDIHWADVASLDLFRYLARQLDAIPVLLVATYRTDEVDPTPPLAGLYPTLVREANPVRIEPRPLEDEAVQQLVQHSYTLSGADSVRLVGYLQARAEGNPFFLHELLHALEQEHRLRPGTGGWRIGELATAGLPRLLLQAMERRLARLSRRAQAALAAAAVIGHETSQSLWATVADLDEASRLGCMDELVSARLLVETDGGVSMRFSHALIRQALYEGSLAQLRLSHRRALHCRVGEVLAASAEADPDAVAYHFQQAGDPRAVDWLLRAAARAERALAWLTAAERYAAALALLDAADASPADRAMLRYRLALLRQYEDAPGSERLLDEAVRLATEAGLPKLAAWSRFRRGAIAGYGGQVGIGLAQMETALASVESMDDAVDMGATGPLAGLFMRASDHNPRGMLAGWLALAGRLRDARAMGAAPFVLGATAWGASGQRHAGVHAPYDYAFTGRPDAARRAFVALRAELQAAGDQFMAAIVQSNELIWVALPYAADDLVERRRVATLTDDVLRLASGVYDEVPSLWLKLPLLVLEGEWSTARRVAELAVAIRGGAQHVALPVLAVLARDQGDPDVARALLREVLPDGPATAPGTTFFAGTLVLQRLAASLALDVADLRTARAWLEMHDRWLAWSGALLGKADGQLAWASYYRVADQPSRAEQCARRGLAAASNPRQPLAIVAAHRLLGELATDAGQFDEAATRLEMALAMADACAAPYERALTLLAQAELAFAGGRRRAGFDLLQGVQATGNLLGAARMLARVAALSTPGTPKGRLRKVQPGGLSAREVEVIRLIAAGLSNTQIAARLTLSLPTVKNHVAHVLAKTDSRNRAAAAAFALREGLT